MAFNGDGPHSKRQRLEESGHRVSTIWTYALLSRLRLASRDSLRLRSAARIMTQRVASRTFTSRRRYTRTRGRRVAIYRSNDRGREHGSRARVRRRRRCRRRRARSRRAFGATRAAPFNHDSYGRAMHAYGASGRASPARSLTMGVFVGRAADRLST